MKALISPLLCLALIAVFVLLNPLWAFILFVIIVFVHNMLQKNANKAIAREPKWLQIILILIALLFVAVFIFLPLYTIFTQAFEKGIDAYAKFDNYFKAINERDTFAAIKLTLVIAALCVPLNTIFGVMLAWAIAKFEFRGKNIITTLIELPFAVSPVIAGLMFILLFGSYGWFGGWLHDHHIKIVFALPGMVLATAFVTFPFVAKELIPLMQEMGKDDEEAALTLGASGLQTFFKVTLPNIKWGLLYGVILTNARAMGEFGAVAVVSGVIRGVTMTMPLHIEVLYNEYMFSAAFAVASLLTLLAIVTLVAKTIIEHFIALQRKAVYFDVERKE